MPQSIHRRLPNVSLSRKAHFLRCHCNVRENQGLSVRNSTKHDWRVFPTSILPMTRAPAQSFLLKRNGIVSFLTRVRTLIFLRARASWEEIYTFLLRSHVFVQEQENAVTLCTGVLPAFYVQKQQSMYIPKTSHPCTACCRARSLIHDDWSETSVDAVCHLWHSTMIIPPRPPINKCIDSFYGMIYHTANLRRCWSKA